MDPAKLFTPSKRATTKPADVNPALERERDTYVHTHVTTNIKPRRALMPGVVRVTVGKLDA